MPQTINSGLIFVQIVQRNVGSPVALFGGMAANEIMMLALDDVVPDPEQPRRHFEREAMERLKETMVAVGQLQPIRVRKVDGQWMIVDGQRRWLALSALAKRYAEDERFRVIRAYVGGEQDDDEASRRVVQVLSNIGEDLTLTEKAESLAEVRAAEPGLKPAELAGRFGVPEGQVNFLIQLASAPPFIRSGHEPPRFGCEACIAAAQPVSSFFGLSWDELDDLIERFTAECVLDLGWPTRLQPLVADFLRRRLR